MENTNTYFFEKNVGKLVVPKDHSYDSVVPVLVRQAKAIADKSNDYIVKNCGSHDMQISGGGILSFNFGQSREEYYLRDFALYQLCKKIGMPPAFFYYLKRQRPAELRNLAYINANMLLKHNREDLLLRMCGKDVRGVLSTRYLRFDTDRILDVFTDYFEGNSVINKSNIKVKGYVNNMERFHIRFTNSQPIKGLIDKDIECGLQIDSSDVGRSSVRIRFFIYKQLCTNGLTVGFDEDLFKHSHIGKITADKLFYEGIRRSFEVFPILASETAELIKMSDKFSIIGSALLDFAKDGDAAKSERQAMKTYLGISEEALSTIAGIANNSYRPTTWGYVNAITEYAQKYDFERRAELEQLAGGIFNNPGKFFDRAA